MIRNTGRHPDRLTFEVVGSAASWTTLDPPVLGLDSGAGAVLRVVFHPPRAAHVRAGQTPFGLLTTSERDKVSSIVEELLVLGSFADLSLELAPPLCEGSRGRYVFVVHNGGNTTVHMTITARDVDGALALACSSPAMTVYPGSSGSCQVRAHARGRRWRGPTAPHQFQVIAHVRGEDPIMLTGTLLPARRRGAFR
jgi:hypothetical protein